MILPDIERVEKLPAGNVPYLKLTIIATSSKQFAVAAKCQAVDVPTVAFQTSASYVWSAVK